MKAVPKINAIMFKLLIEKEMNNFTVVELRNAALDANLLPQDPNEARKKIYRQILNFQRKGWLNTTEVDGSKRYVVSDEFLAQSFASHKAKYQQPKTSRLIQNDDKKVLCEELSCHKGELEITLGEIQEYQSLIARFPSLGVSLSKLLYEAQIRSANLLGKVKAVTATIDSLRSETKC
ncbi:hypothetical protein K0504_07860 [Neiella marina]|uniref:Transcriptional regulator VspR n=1 Tax=Neiella holothuriorum TaxID=2870530 RepID=A0ABS7EFG2_9GAMM|nr:hypothetical protein [Neiella holothuriorum]MBW8190949.1 hypothetical protein [Neiella holothuriorum]